MDMNVFILLLALIRKMPGTAVSQSLANAQRAEEAAALAQQHSVGFEDGGTGLILKPLEEV